METIVFDRGGSDYMVNQARLIHSVEEIDHAGLDHSEGWDIDQASPFITWIAGDFVEGDKANSNKQFWTAGDLELAEYTIKYAPLNMVHKFRTPVGFYAATRTVSLDRLTLVDSSLALEDLDLDSDDLEAFLAFDELLAAIEAADGVVIDEEGDEAKKGVVHAPYKIVKRGKKWTVVNNIGETKATFKTRTAALAYQQALYKNVPGAAKMAATTPWTGGKKAKTSKASLSAFDDDTTGSMKIQALSGLWSHIFPQENAQAEAASEEGTLFFSMECRGSHLVCAGDMGCGEKFDYADASSHCDHLLSRTSIRHIVNPVFRGGALIVPPVKPGWKQAGASVINEAVMAEAAAFAEQNERQYTAVAADGGMTASAWEHLMSQVLASADGR
jgi:hypothetical protein